MAPFRGLSGTMGRERLDIPGLTPREMGDPEFSKAESAGLVGADGTTSAQVDFAPLSEVRVMLADRIHSVFQPDPNYANVDPQKGGAPGNPGGNPGHGDPSVSFITSQQEDGTTVVGGMPNSPIKRSFGLADWTESQPTAVADHVAIVKFANPNRPQVNPTPFNTEGPQQNTQYTTPSPWAVGVFIG